ncbi:MAG: MerR family transcriptional regulator [Chitinophagaceae bacterium]|nr:MAG: MerR family transcriptional regulator [Chitinophagaceae bacterium]
MTNENLISASDFCECHRIDVSFISTLSDFGLIRTHIVSQQVCLEPDELEKLEKIITLHNQLDINLEGIEAISHLLERMDELRQEIVSLKNKLRLYE